MALNLQLPLDSGWGYVSSEFGPRKPIQVAGGGWSSSFHKGMDFARAGGTPIYAPADGVVIFAGRNGGLGNHVSMRHQEAGPRLSTSVSHMRDGSITVKKGQSVKKGQQIGTVGTTGSSNGNHLHFETYVDGEAINPRNFYATYGGGSSSGGGSGSVSTTQRVVGPEIANRRIGSPSKSAPKGEPLKAGETGNFKGWTRGESVQGNDIWYIGAYGTHDYFWSGGFVGGANTAGLTDLTPAQAMGPKQRRTITDLNGRAEPYAYSAVLQTLPVNTIGDFDGWKHGDSVSGETRWVRGAHNHNWFSLLYLEPRNVDNLEDLNTPTTEPEVPPVNQTEEEVTPNLVTPSIIDFPSWIKFDVVLDPDGQKPTINLDTFRYYGVIYNPIESHTHWWNEPGKGGTHDGNVNYIRGQLDLSVNFVVSENRITLMVPLNKNALTTGKRNPYAWKSENDPTLSEQQYKTMGYLHYIVEKLNPSLLNEPIRLHKEFMSTTCSGIDTAKVRYYADSFRTGVLDPATGLPPITPGPDPEPQPETKEISKEFYEMLQQLPKEFRSLADDIDAGLV